MKNQLIVINPDQLAAIVETAVLKAIQNSPALKQPGSTKLYSIYQARKIMRIGDKKIKQLIASGIVKTNASNKISEYELNKYLGNE